MVSLRSARLLALDWGSSSLRAFLLGSNGEALDTRTNDRGASLITGGDAAFAAQLRHLAGDWLDAYPGLPVVACGMVGSQHGWRQAPYLQCPASLNELHAAAVMATALGVPGAGNDVHVHILPGVRCINAGGSPDVMRGEETQVCGLLEVRPELMRNSALIMPGTHSKWVQVRDGRIETFTTYMTGELYTLLRQHSVLGRLMKPEGAFDADAFDEGVRLAAHEEPGALQRNLFSVRTRGLFDEIAPAALADYLSGLLLGDEIAVALRRVGDEVALALIGDHTLCDRYRRALTAAGRPPTILAGNTAASGLWHQAVRGGLIAGD